MSKCKYAFCNNFYVSISSKTSRTSAKEHQLGSVNAHIALSLHVQKNHSYCTVINWCALHSQRWNSHKSHIEVLDFRQMAIFTVSDFSQISDFLVPTAEIWRWGEATVYLSTFVYNKIYAFYFIFINVYKWNSI